MPELWELTDLLPHHAPTPPHHATAVNYLSSRQFTAHGGYGGQVSLTTRVELASAPLSRLRAERMLQLLARRQHDVQRDAAGWSRHPTIGEPLGTRVLQYPGPGLPQRESLSDRRARNRLIREGGGKLRVEGIHWNLEAIRSRPLVCHPGENRLEVLRNVRAGCRTAAQPLEP